MGLVVAEWAAVQYQPAIGPLDSTAFGDRSETPRCGGALDDLEVADKTVYDYYAKWENDGTTLQVHDLLRDRTTAAVVDAQSVKTSANVAETSQGIDAGRKIKGRKRHLITDTLGLVLAVLVTAANVHDTTGGKLLLDNLAAAHPSVTKVWDDGGYQNSIFNHGARLAIDVEVVQRPRPKGFEPLPKRWVIERTFGWLSKGRSLLQPSLGGLWPLGPSRSTAWLARFVGLHELRRPRQAEVV